MNDDAVRERLRETATESLLTFLSGWFADADAGREQASMMADAVLDALGARTAREQRPRARRQRSLGPPRRLVDELVAEAERGYGLELLKNARPRLTDDDRSLLRYALDLAMDTLDQQRDSEIGEEFDRLGFDGIETRIGELADLKRKVR